MNRLRKIIQVLKANWLQLLTELHYTLL